MANNREFKKSIEALSSALVSEIMASLYNEKEADTLKLNEAIDKIAKAMVRAKQHTGKVFDKGLKDFNNLKEYNLAKAKFTKEKYKEAIAKYNEGLGEALKAYNEGMPKTSESKK